MLKNLIIFVLILLCGLQGYILYTNKDKDWLSQSIKQVKIDFQEFIKPNTRTPAPTNATIIDTDVNSTHNTTTSIAFEHLSINVNCTNANHIVDKKICADVDLSDQDKRLNFILKKWSNSSKASDYPITKQAQWLILRYESCSNTTASSLKICIETLTEKRIQAITGQI